MSGLPYNKLKNENQECKKTYQSRKLAKQMTWSSLRDCTKWLLKQKKHRKRHEPQEVHKPYVQVKKTLRCPSPSTPPPRNTFNHRTPVGTRMGFSGIRPSHHWNFVGTRLKPCRARSGPHLDSVGTCKTRPCQC
jgi:hypothetical protein